MTTLADALDQWIAHRARMVGLGLVRASTHDNHVQIAGTLKARLGDHALAGLRKSHVELFVGARLATCAPVTVQGEVNVLRQVLNWCVDEQLIGARPRLPSVKVPATEDALPPEEAVRWVLIWLPERHGDALQFMLLTGLSPHELERLQTCDLRVEQISDGARRGLVVHVSIGGRADFAVKTAARRRQVPMNAAAWAIWQRRTLGTRADHRVFPRRDATEKAIQRLRMNPGLAADQPAGLALVTPKTMRSWFASAVARESPEHVLQRLLGHVPGSKITRRHYVRSTDAQLVDAVKTRLWS